MKTWFKFQAKADKPDTVEVSIYDDIGAYGVSAKQFISELSAHKGKSVQVNINTPGGDMFAGLAMYNALRAHGSPITTKTMGIAASAGSVVFMAGDKRVMPENTFVMVHNPWIFTAGNADELRDMADTLDYVGESLVKTYAARTGMSEAEIREMLAEDTYLSAEDAVAKGFADEIEPALAIAASFDLERLPENMRAAFNAAQEEAPAEPPPGKQEPQDNAGTASGTSDTDDTSEGEQSDASSAPTATLAEQIAAAASGVGLEAHAARFALASSSLDEANAMIAAAREITTLCKVAGKPQAAAAFIDAGKGVSDVRTELLNSLAEESDNQPTRSHITNGAATQTAESVWAKIFPTRQTKE